MGIRRFEETDFPAILAIYASAKLDELRFEENPAAFELQPLEQDKKRLAGLRESDIYVYEDGGVVGYGAVYGAEIRALFVHPLARNQGVGRRLLAFMLDRIKGRPVLYVAKTNIAAKTLYEDYGFRVTNEFMTDYNGVPVRANEMVRDPA